jgi:molybdopterin converting factor small subunit
MKIRVVISGRNYEAAEAVPEELTLPDGSSLDEALRTLSGLIPGGKGLPDSCLVAVSGTHLGTLRTHRPRDLEEGDELVLIAPVAGG